MVGAAGGFAGMAAGSAWAERSAFCEPGLLQGNPVCIFLMLFGVVIGGTVLAGVGALTGTFIDAAGTSTPEGKAEQRRKEPVLAWAPGEATVTGARYGLAITVATIVAIWLTEGLEGWVTVKQHPLGLLVIAPIVLGIAWGQYVDRR
jgi:hypothetical protein